MTCRRSVTAASLLLSLLALTACGSSSSSSSSSSPAPLTVAQATTAADAINLTAADVPGSTASANPVSASDKASDAALAACSGGVSPSLQIVDLNSPSFASGTGLNQTQVSSSVMVLPTAAYVQQNLKALTSAKGHACLSTSLNKVLAQTTPQGVTFSSGAITTLPFSSANTDGGFGVRVTVNAVAAGQHIPFFIDVVGFAKGPAEVELQTLGISAPYPAAMEAKLLSILVANANAHVPTS